MRHERGEGKPFSRTVFCCRDPMGKTLNEKGVCLCDLRVGNGVVDYASLYPDPTLVVGILHNALALSRFTLDLQAY